MNPFLLSNINNMYPGTTGGNTNGKVTSMSSGSLTALLALLRRSAIPTATGNTKIVEHTATFIDKVIACISKEPI
jgi:hypothetical protein